MKENLLDFVGYHPKWHGTVQDSRRRCLHSINDYLLEEIFNRLGIEKGTFVEFGAWDGIVLSNTRFLFEKGWGGLLVEGDYAKAEELRDNYSAYPSVTTVHSFVDAKENLIDNLFDKYLEHNIDFCSIDVDGLDLEIFQTFKVNMPKVICIEGGQVLHPFHEEVDADTASRNVQQSLSVINKVFEGRGYKLLCSYQDSFFVKKEYYDLFNLEEDLMTHYKQGLLALPRLPYLQETLKNVNLENEIVNHCLKDIFKEGEIQTMEQKQAWVNKNYSLIKEKIESYEE
jgi:hypothetical protein